MFNGTLLYTIMDPEEVTGMLACFYVIQYPNKNVALVASDILHLLISYVDHLQKFPPETPKKIVEVNQRRFSLCTSLYGHSTKMGANQRNHRCEITMQRLYIVWFCRIDYVFPLVFL